VTISTTVGVLGLRELAERLGRSERYVESLLRGSERDGVVELVDGGWRLSAWGCVHSATRRRDERAPLDDAQDG
jgi:hypothetical protein